MKQLTKEEIRKQTLEELREAMIVNMVRNEVILDSLRDKRKESGNEEKIKVIQQIRGYEAASLDQEKDLELIERKLKGDK